MDIVVFLSRILLFLYQRCGCRLVGLEYIQVLQVEVLCFLRSRVEGYEWYFRHTVQQSGEGYTLDFIQYYISSLKVLFQKCEQYFSLFIAYYEDSIGIISLFTGCIIYLLYLFIVQTSEVQYLVLGVLYSRCMMLYIQLQELYMLSVIGLIIYCWRWVVYVTRGAIVLWCEV